MFGSRMLEHGAARARRHAAVQVRRQPHPDHGSRTRSPAPTLTRVALRLPRLLGRRAARDPVRAQRRRIQLRHPDHPAAASRRGKRIVEVPIPTYYGDEICYVNGLGYARDVTRDVAALPRPQDGVRLGRDGVRSRSDYELKESGGHLPRAAARLAGAARLGTRTRPRVAATVRWPSCWPIRVTWSPASTCPHERRQGKRLEAFHQADLDHGLPPKWTARSTSWCAPTCSSTCVNPVDLLDQLAARASRPAGVILASVPNFGHWYPRVRVATGPVRLRPARHPRPRPHPLLHRGAASSAWSPSTNTWLCATSATGLPIEIIDRGAGDEAPSRSGLRSAVARVDHLAVAVAPSLFAYQMLYELRHA